MTDRTHKGVQTFRSSGNVRGNADREDHQDNTEDLAYGNKFSVGNVRSKKRFVKVQTEHIK